MKISPRSIHLHSFVLLGLLAATASVVAAPHLELTHASVRAVIAVQDKVTGALMDQLPDILGTAVGVNAADQAVLRVYVDVDGKTTGQLLQAMPKNINGVPVEIELTDKFRAFAGKPGGQSSGGGATVSHTARQTPPIQLGTSGGWTDDLANGYCCGGTLGSLIQVNGTQYIMSNYHVFESDIVTGGNGIVATDNSPVIQPGLIDVGCRAENAQPVGNLHLLNSLPNSNVDVSVAQATPGQVAANGAILEIGPLSKYTQAASIALAVKKSGRTTGLTRSSISALNATISVAYENECAGGPAFTKTFKGQIVIANRGSRFLNSGDSGSLMVEDVTRNPRAIGLLYAGSSSSAIANPIDEVLTFVGPKLGGTATMVGQ